MAPTCLSAPAVFVGAMEEAILGQQLGMGAVLIAMRSTAQESQLIQLLRQQRDSPGRIHPQSPFRTKTTILTGELLDLDPRLHRPMLPGTALHNPICTDHYVRSRLDPLLLPDPCP
jgi:hypothetical protein